MMRALLAMSCFAAALSVSAAADGPFDGTWRAEVLRRGPTGNQVLTMTFATDQGKVTGSLTIAGAKAFPIEWGMTTGDVIAFKVKQDPTPGSSIAGNGPVDFMYLGKREGDRIAFGRRPFDLTLGAPVELVATRVAK